VLQGHKAPVVSLAVSPDGATLASASWDHTARVWSLADIADNGEPRVLDGHKDNVNGVAFTPDGKSVVTAGYDATCGWPMTDAAPVVVTSAAQHRCGRPDGDRAAGADGPLSLRHGTDW
jgi:cytochrome c